MLSRAKKGPLISLLRGIRFRNLPDYESTAPTQSHALPYTDIREWTTCSSACQSSKSDKILKDNECIFENLGDKNKDEKPIVTVSIRDRLFISSRL